MKTVTNYQPGARGVNMKTGATLWIEPGQTVEIDEGEVNGDLPDFGSKPNIDAAADHATALAAAASEIDALKADIAARDATIADLTAQLEAVTAPKK